MDVVDIGKKPPMETILKDDKIETVSNGTIETPYGKEEKILGGAATYTCITSSYFTPPNIVSIVGYDFPMFGLALWR